MFIIICGICGLLSFIKYKYFRVIYLPFYKHTYLDFPNGSTIPLHENAYNKYFNM